PPRRLRPGQHACAPRAPLLQATPRPNLAGWGGHRPPHARGRRAGPHQARQSARITAATRPPAPLSRDWERGRGRGPTRQRRRHAMTATLLETALKKLEENQVPQVKKVALAYSGGLDSALCTVLAKEKYGAEELVPIMVDIGQGEEELQAGLAKAKQLKID